jgi:hypothetical protein
MGNLSVFYFSQALSICSLYSKMMFLGLNQVYYWGFKCNTHNNYKYIIETKWNYNWKLFTIEREAPSKVGLSLR